MNWKRSFEPTETKSTSVHQLVELPEQRRHFQHGAELQLARQRMAEARQMLHFLLQQCRAPARSSSTSVTIGIMILQLGAGGRLQQRPKLGAQQARPVERQADRTPAERRVFFLGRAEIGHDLVAADIERAEGDRLRRPPA